MNFAIRKSLQPKDMHLDVKGARLRYRDAGAGPAIVFVHGWTLDLDMWEPQAAALSPGYRIIRLDRRGFGLSTGHPSLNDDVADLQALCRHLRLQCVALVGMSQGARVVLQMTQAWPAMVACLILDGPPGIGRPASEARDPQELPYEDYRRLAQSHGMAAFRREWTRHPLATLRTDEAAVRDLLAGMIARYPGNDLLAPAPRPAEIETPPAIQSIVHPVLVIGGAHDIDSRRRFAAGLACDLPRAERVEIPAAGHLCNLDNPPAYNRALRKFLERHVPAHSTP